MPAENNTQSALDTTTLTGTRTGPYLGFNAVSRVQVWQWCSAMGDRNPLYLDDDYRRGAGFDRVVAPPAMMQMWTMRDVNFDYAPGSVVPDAPSVFETLAAHGFPSIVAVSYDIEFLRLLLEGDRAHHYSTIVTISALKKTALGEGYFVTERAEYLDQTEAPFAEALITYFVYRAGTATAMAVASDAEPSPALVATPPDWRADFTDIDPAMLAEGQALPELAIPITHKLIVSGALATQDFMDVHHNAPAARVAGMPDIFMNILTTCGLCARYLSDWAGPGSRLRKLSFKLLAPNVPGDTMVMQGRIAGLRREGDRVVDVEFAGRNSRGFHVTGAATLALKG